MHSSSDSKSSTALSQFIFGLTTPLRSVGLILFNPKLLTLSALPILLSCAVLAVAFYALMAGAYTWLTHWLTILQNGWMMQFSSVVHFLISAIILVTFFLFSSNVVLVLTALFSSPLNDLLAESTETALQEQKIKNNFLYTVKVFFLDLRKTILTFFLSIFFSLGVLIPGIGLFFLVGIALVNTFTFITYPQNRRAHGIRDSIAWIFQNFWLALGCGTMITLLFSIPVFNLFAIPVSVVAGTMLYLRK